MNEAIRKLEMEIYELKQQLSKLRTEATPEPVADYTFQTATGDVTWADLFGDKEHLFLIHNMGESCDYCTLWADVLHGYMPMLEQKASVVLVNGDSPAMQQAQSAKRGWRVRCVTDTSGEFTEAMGMMENGYRAPGMSAFHRGADGAVVRTGVTPFGPGDDFCPVWPAFDLLKGGADGWEPS